MFVIVVLIIYMYGAMTLKYVAGAESCIEGVSMTIFGDQNKLEEIMAPFDPYYLGLALFGGLSIVFSFGNIENSKGLQMVSTILRFISIALMIGTSIYSLIAHGAASAEQLEWFNFG